MLRSLFSGVTGLRTHQTKMDVIGNNIANVNTTAFKASRVTFKDVYYQTVSSASTANNDRGGTNPVQIGYGTNVASIDLMNTRGGVQLTDRTLDLYISGDGFFTVQDGNGSVSYTRVGNFMFDVNGNLVDPNGNYVCGWQPAANVPGAVLTGISIPDISDYTNIAIGKDGIISGIYSGPNPEHLPDMTEVINNLSSLSISGYSNIRYSNGVITGDDTASGNADIPLFNNVRINADMTISGNNLLTGEDNQVIAGLDSLVDNPADYYDFTISSDGVLLGVYKGHFPGMMELLGNINGPSLVIPGYTNVKFQNGVITGDNIATGAVDEIIYSNVRLGVGGSFIGDDPGLGITDQVIPGLSLTGLTNRLEDYTNITLNNDGNIIAVYSAVQVPAHIPGEVEILGQIALAKFTNPEGLSQEGGTYFKQTTNSGDASYSIPGDRAVGTLISGGLEMSNVDLSKEFTDMIITQRGFQANSRIITVSDEMLQELVNLKR